MVGRIQQAFIATIPDVVNAGDYAAEAIEKVAIVVAICVGAWFAYRVIWVALKWAIFVFAGPIAGTVLAIGLWWKGKD